MKEKARMATSIIYKEHATADGCLFGIEPEHREAIEKIVAEALRLGETMAQQEEDFSFPAMGGLDD